MPSLNKALGNFRPGAKKRFILWDDFKPAEYADDDSIPVHLFLSLFIGQPTEIQAIAQQVSQVACAPFMAVSGFGLAALLKGG